MKSFVTALAFASGTAAFVTPRWNYQCSCSFQITAYGGPGGQVGQLSDGQNRIGQGLPPATYCINNGGLTDQNGRGCFLTPPTSQWQCDAGAAAEGGFAVGCDGTITYNGNSHFQSCPTGDHGGYNIYETAPAGQGGCVAVTLKADGCYPGCPKTCPANLNGPYEFPHLIIPVDSSKPNTAPGTSYIGEVSPTISSLFIFDIPASDAGKTCSLVFLFPTQSQLQTSSYTFSGAGAIDFCMLASAATQSTDYANAPKCMTDYGMKTVAPGNSYTIATFACPAGQRIGFEMSAMDGTCFKYFQDYNPAPIGLYISKC